jgi:Rho-binding antiterminator
MVGFRGMAMDEYRLVSCDFYDELESLATLRQKARIVYWNQAHEIVEVQDYIMDVYAANQADFLKLKSGVEIRLDQIVSVNSKPLSYESCSTQE